MCSCQLPTVYLFGIISLRLTLERIKNDLFMLTVFKPIAPANLGLQTGGARASEDNSRKAKSVDPERVRADMVNSSTKNTTVDAGNSSGKAVFGNMGFTAPAADGSAARSSSATRGRGLQRGNIKEK